MLAEAPARAIRVGGVNVAPGEARTLLIALAARASAEKTAAVSVPVWAAVGPKPGPRVSVVAALHGFEATAARAASELIRSIDPAGMSGSLLIVPVLRAGGSFAPGERPAPTWTFPGDAGGTRAERDAFALFAEVTVGSAALILLTAPPLGRRAIWSVRASMDNPRTRRLALESGATVALSTRGRAGSLRAAATDAGVSALEIRVGGGAGRESTDVGHLVAAVRAILNAIGVLPLDGPGKTQPKNEAKSQPKNEDKTDSKREAKSDPRSDASGEMKVGAKIEVKPAPRTTASGPLLIRRTSTIRTPVGGLVEPLVAAGALAQRGAVLARVVPPLGGRPIDIKARRDGLVLESPLRLTARARTRLFTVGDVARADVARARAALPPSRKGDRSRERLGERSAHDTKVRAGWVEHIALPNLGIARLKAKIDTGARTSALHVARMKTVDTAGGPGRRPILEITVPGGPRGARPTKVRAAVREYVVVRDTSGRMERRPVIETALQIGPFKKRILVTLTNRGDMLFPMLIGRTALGPGIVVDPSRRYLLSIS